MLITYLGFIVAVLILGWAIFEISRRYFRQRGIETKPLNTWVKFDSTFEDDLDKSVAGEESDEQEESVSKANIHMRAQQNGYHSESKKLL